jgi:uncharacterized protein (DUF1778 family)
MHKVSISVDLALEYGWAEREYMISVIGAYAILRKVQVGAMKPNKVVTVRMSEEEHAEIIRAAKALKLNKSEFLRYAALDGIERSKKILEAQGVFRFGEEKGETDKNGNRSTIDRSGEQS